MLTMPIDTVTMTVIDGTLEAPKVLTKGNSST
jgi:hypothetical protein